MCDGQAGAQIEVTPAMLEAGVEVLREMHIGDTDLDYRVEQIFMAMVLAFSRPQQPNPEHTPDRV